MQHRAGPQAFLIILLLGEGWPGEGIRSPPGFGCRVRALLTIHFSLVWCILSGALRVRGKGYTVLYSTLLWYIIILYYGILGYIIVLPCYCIII